MQRKVKGNKRIRINRKRAAFEIRQHGIDPQEFYDMAGYRSDYDMKEILSWLAH